MQPAVQKKKKKISIRNSESLPVVQQQTHIRPHRGLNQSEIGKGGRPPLIGRGPDIPVRVCTFENACAAAVRQRERWVEMHAVLPT